MIISRTYQIITMCFILLSALMPSCNPQGEIDVMNAGVLIINVDSHGNISFEVSPPFKIPTPLGTISFKNEINLGKISRDNGVEKTLTICLNKRCEVYNLHDQDIEVTFQSAYYEAVTVKTQDGNVLITLTSAQLGNYPATQPRINNSQSSNKACGGQVAHFKIGETIVVSREGDDLLILTGLNYGDPAISMAVTGDRLKIENGPECVYRPNYGEDMWYWHIYSYTDDVWGWVADGTSSETWLCPVAYPNCDQ